MLTRVHNLHAELLTVEAAIRICGGVPEALLVEATHLDAKHGIVNAIVDSGEQSVEEVETRTGYLVGIGFEVREKLAFELA